MTADEYGYDPDKDCIIKDNEFFDGTDAAHPAWWRGEEHCYKVMVDLISKWFECPMEDFESGVHQPDLQSIRMKIKELRMTQPNQNKPVTRQQVYKEKCYSVSLLELGNMLFSERNPQLKRVVEEVLAERISIGYEPKKKFEEPLL